jgi:cardiolipin synthase
MLALTIYQKRRFNRDFEVIFIGKVTTALVMAGFCSLVLEWPILPGAHIAEIALLPGWGAEAAPLGIWLLYIGVVTSWITAILYLNRGLRPDNSRQSARPGLRQQVKKALETEDPAQARRTGE